MRLDPATLEPIEAGDRLRAAPRFRSRPPASTPEPRCVGSNYEINPTVTARVVLSPSPKADAGFLPLSESRTACSASSSARTGTTTARSTIPNTETTITDLAALPCTPTACYVNLIVGATNKKAKRGNVVVLGADRPDGSVSQGQGPAQPRPGARRRPRPDR